MNKFKSNLKWSATLLLLSCFSFPICPLVAQADESASVNTVVFQSVSDAQSKIDPKIISFDFGTTTPLDDKYAEHGIEHTFTLTNRSPQAISITELRPSSICIKKFYVTDGQHTQVSVTQFDYGLFPDKLNLPIKIASGAQVKVFVSIDPLSVFTGPVDEHVDMMFKV